MVVTMQVTALRIAPVMVVMVLMAIIAVVMVITITRSARHRLRLRSTVGAFLVAAMRSLLDRSELITQTGDALSQGNEITMGAWRTDRVPAVTETATSSTPGIRLTAASIFAAHEAQSIPLTRKRVWRRGAFMGCPFASFRGPYIL